VLVGEQLDAVVERSDRAQQIVAETRTEQAREFVGFHAADAPVRTGRFRRFLLARMPCSCKLEVDPISRLPGPPGKALDIALFIATSPGK
jgi:hypothetical protein